MSESDDRLASRICLQFHLRADLEQDGMVASRVSMINGPASIFFECGARRFGGERLRISLRPSQYSHPLIRPSAPVANALTNNFGSARRRDVRTDKLHR